MKILHTADWHLNTTLGRVDLNPQIINALEQIAGLLEVHEVEVMLVAGDLFEKSRPDQMRRAVGEIKRIFLPFLECGGAIVAIAGNHDSEIWFDTMRDALRLATPHPSGRGGFHLTAMPEYLRLKDKRDQEVQFALLPYPTPRSYLRGEKIHYDSIEQKNAFVKEGFAQALKTLEEKKIDPTLPSVLMSHVHVSGAQTHTLYKISEIEDVIFKQSDIPTHWAYVAYGHIHLPGAVPPTSQHVRYSGSIARLDAAERDDIKSVVVFEVDQSGRKGEVQILPLQSAPFYQIEINDPDDIEKLPSEYSDLESALVFYTLRWQPQKHNLNKILGELDRIFPNWYGRKIERVENIQATSANGSTPLPVYDVAGNALAYLNERFENHAEREELMTLAHEILAQALTPSEVETKNPL